MKKLIPCIITILALAVVIVVKAYNIKRRIDFDLEF